jgi:hypothetical protein
MSARLDDDAEELLLVIAVETGNDSTVILVVGLPLAGRSPARLVARHDSSPKAQIAIAA